MATLNHRKQIIKHSTFFLSILQNLILFQILIKISTALIPFLTVLLLLCFDCVIFNVD